MTLQVPREGSQREVFSFGSFRLFPIERRLERNGRQVEIPDRAPDILIVLVLP
jgi:DNA-binding winged helix-turn-helix (wHTH) protein